MPLHSPLSLAKEKPGRPRCTPHSRWPRALMASSVGLGASCWARGAARSASEAGGEKRHNDALIVPRCGRPAGRLLRAGFPGQGGACQCSIGARGEAAGALASGLQPLDQRHRGGRRAHLALVDHVGEHVARLLPSARSSDRPAPGPSARRPMRMSRGARPRRPAPWADSRSRSCPCPSAGADTRSRT